MNTQKAFLDTNVLLRSIIGENGQENSMMEILKKNNFQIVTFQKCIYELYSMVKAVAVQEMSGSHLEDPIKDAMPRELIDICHVLRKKFSKAGIFSDDRFFWYNQCEEWLDRNFIEELDCIENDNKDLYNSLELQKDILLWKKLIRMSFAEINRKIKRSFIHVYTYHDVYCSDWYNSEGFCHEEDLMKNSFVPNSDFEILIAAAFCNARVFITNETKKKGIIRRTGTSWGTCCAPSFTSFCCPETLEKAIGDQFNYRVYHPNSCN